MDTSNKLTFTLISDFRWSGKNVLKIRAAIEQEVNAHVQIRHEINNWDRFNVIDGEVEGTSAILDTVNNTVFIGDLKGRQDASRLATLLNNSFNDADSLKR